MMLTWFFAGLCLHHAMTNPASKVIFWGPDEDRANPAAGLCLDAMGEPGPAAQGSVATRFALGNGRTTRGWI